MKLITCFILPYKFNRQSDGKSTHWTPRSDPSNVLRTGAQGMLSLPAGRQGLILSGAFYPDLKIGVWRRRTYQ
jgi:hypothetical protein